MRQCGMLRIAIVAMLLLGGGVLAVRQLEQVSRPAAMTAAPTPVSTSSSARNVVLKRVGNGHFAVNARVDGRPVAFLVDTGASLVALRESDARRIGYYPRHSDFKVKVRTANGIGLAAMVELRSVEIGDILVRDLQALVHPDEALGVNLLGMSFLARVRWTHDRGQLVLEQ
jgi:aspartyl protease family protein